MNILIRKNFSSEASKERSYGKLGNRHRKPHISNRSRESVFSGVDDHPCPFRTHIYLPSSSGGELLDDDDITPPTRSSFFNVPFNNNGRKSSVTKLDYLLPTDDLNRGRKVSFEDESAAQNYRGNLITPEPIKKVEPVTLSNLDKDCFIIPIANIDRFLPPGVPVPLAGAVRSSLNVLEIDDPKLGVIVNLMSQMEPIEPLLESPLSLPLTKQKQLAISLLNEIGSSKMASEGILLSNLEKNSAFPFIAYYIINKNQTNPSQFYQFVRLTTLKKFDPQMVRYTTGHTFDLFNEVATIARPPLQPTSKRPRSNTTGYIVTIYKVFEGDDKETFEKNWLYWTGARMIYRYLPKSAGLRRITLHKSQLTGDKLYLLIVECSNFLNDFSATALLLPALRARLCGYTGIYRSVAVF